MSLSARRTRPLSERPTSPHDATPSSSAGRLVLLGLVLLFSTSAGCAACEEEYVRVSPRDYRRVERVTPASPGLKAIVRTIERRVDVTEYTLAVQPPQEAAKRDGLVDVGLEIVHGLDCGGRADWIAGPTMPLGAQYSACVVDWLDGTHFLAQLTIRNDMPHVLYLARTTLALRSPDRRVMAIEDRSALAEHWQRVRVDTAESGRAFVAGANGTVPPGAGGFQWVREPTIDFSSAMRSITPLDMERPVLPGEVRRGYVVIHIPPGESGGEFLLGLYDVTVATGPDALAKRVVSFEFPLRRVASTRSVLAAERVKEWVRADGSTAGAGPSRSAELPSTGSQDGGADEVTTCALGSLDALTLAQPVLRSWIGKTVSVLMQDGRQFRGRLAGVSDSAMILRDESDERTVIDPFSAARVELVR